MLVAKKFYGSHFLEDVTIVKKLEDINRLELEEMKRHKWYLSELAGREVDKSYAFLDWVTKYAKTWRVIHDFMKKHPELLKEEVIDNLESFLHKIIPRCENCYREKCRFCTVSRVTLKVNWLNTNLEIWLKENYEIHK